MKIGEKKTKDTCDIEERKVKKWIKEYEDMAVSGGIGNWFRENEGKTEN